MTKHAVIIYFDEEEIKKIDLACETSIGHSTRMRSPFLKGLALKEIKRILNEQ